MSDNLSQLVEGPFRNFTIRRVRPQDIDKIIQHIKDYFLHDEPISKLVGYSEEFAEEMLHVVKHFLPDNLSVWMEDNETGEVAAVRVSFISRKDDNSWDHFPRKTRGSQIYHRICDAVFQKGNVFEIYGISECVDFLIASSATKYRQQGLAKELYRRSMDLIKAEGFPLAMSIFTSPYTRSAVKRLGFEEIARVHFKDVKDGNGELIFDEGQLDEESFAAIMIKQL